MPSPMRSRSFGSVTVDWLDRKAAVQSVEDAARRLRKARPEVEEVHLYGSLARGEGGPNSDADLLVIVSGTSIPPRDRAAAYRGALGDPGLPLDLVLYTRAEFETLRNAGHTFLVEVLAEARRLA